MLRMWARSIYDNDNCTREKQFGHTWLCIITKSTKNTDFNPLPQRNLELHDEILRASIMHDWEWRIPRFEIHNYVRSRVIRSEKTSWLTLAIWKHRWYSQHAKLRTRRCSLLRRWLWVDELESRLLNPEYSSSEIREWAFLMKWDCFEGIQPLSSSFPWPRWAKPIHPCRRQSRDSCRT